MKGYHACRNMWVPVKGEIMQAEIEPINSVDKYAVAAIRGGLVVGYLKNVTSGKFAKTIILLLKMWSEQFEVTGKRYNLVDEEGIHVLCMLQFEKRKVYIDRLISLLPKSWKCTGKSLAKLSKIME